MTVFMPSLPGSSTYSEHSFSGDWTVSDCLLLLCRRKGLLLTLTVAAMICAALISVLQRPVYQARALLEVQPFNENFLEFRDVYAARGSIETGTEMQTLADILVGDSVLERVARNLHLEQTREYQGRGGVLDKLRKDIQVIPTRNSRVVQILCDAQSPNLAANLANTLASTFIDQNIEARRLAAHDTYESLEQAIDKFRRKPAYAGSARNGFGRSDQPSTGRLSADGEADRHLYQSLLEKRNDAWVASVVPQSNYRWIRAAEPPLHPYKPNLALNLAIGGAAGLLLSIGWVMLREQNNPVLREPADAGLWLTLPEVGVIPAAKCRTGVFTTSKLCGRRRDGMPLERTARISESFRAAATSIVSLARDEGYARALVITSPQAMDGKTTVVSNLGIALAEVGNKVLLIDGNLRRPQLHQQFDEANSWGLSDLLQEQNAVENLPLDALTRQTAVPRLSLLPSGAFTDNIFGLLHSGRMSNLIPRFQEAFDYVLVDAPPCMEFADARIMARHAGQLLLVVRANYTNRRAAAAVVHRFRMDGVHVMGFILNRFERATSRYACSSLCGAGYQSGV